MAAATVATPVSPAELDPEEEEIRGEAEEEKDTTGQTQTQQQQQTGPAAAAAGSHNRLSKLPLARIKAIMKTDPDVSLASQESVFIIAKATVIKRGGSPAATTTTTTTHAERFYLKHAFSVMLLRFESKLVNNDYSI